MNEQANNIKQRLMNSWDQMKSRYPITVDMARVQGDEAKEAFLRCIDGVKNAEQIREYFTLDPSEAHLVFSDLLNSGAVRFLEEVEIIAYLKQQAVEYRRQLDFLMSEGNRLVGESCYLSGQIGEMEKSIGQMQTRIPGLTETLGELNSRLGEFKNSASELWESNSELIGLTKDMKHKEEQIRSVLAKIEYEYPKIIKKRTRVGTRLKAVDQKVQDQHGDGENLRQQYLVYHETIDDLRDYFEDAALRVGDMIKTS